MRNRYEVNSILASKAIGVLAEIGGADFVEKDDYVSARVGNFVVAGSGDLEYAMVELAKTLMYVSKR
jgi:hypothetical protein